MLDEWTVSEARSSPEGEEMPQERFLRGPIPLPWLMQMTELGGEACRAGLLLWHVSGLRGQARYGLVVLPSLWREHFTTRQAYSRALARLETAGLIEVDRRPGCRVRVSLRTAPAPEAPTTQATGTGMADATTVAYLPDAMAVI